MACETVHSRRSLHGRSSIAGVERCVIGSLVRACVCGCCWLQGVLACSMEWPYSHLDDDAAAAAGRWAGTVGRVGQLSSARCGVVWCGVVWCGVVWCGVVWCEVAASLLRLLSCCVLSSPVHRYQPTAVSPPLPLPLPAFSSVVRISLPALPAAGRHCCRWTWHCNS